MSHPLAAPVARSQGTLVLLRMGALAVLVPQGAAHSVQARADTVPEGAEGQALATIEAEERRWQVYCLDEALAPLAAVPEGRRICVLLRAGAGLFGLLVDDVVPWTGRTWQGFDLPACMRVPGGPVDALVVHGGRIFPVLGVAALAASLVTGAGAPTPLPEPC